MENNKDTKPKEIIFLEEAGKAVEKGYKIGINTINNKFKNAVVEMVKDIRR